VRGAAGAAGQTRAPEPDDMPEGSVELSDEEDRLLRKSLEDLGYL
jgi:hypothetical protein